MQRGNALKEQAARQQRRTEPVAVPAVAPREKRRVPARPESRLRPCVAAACWLEIRILWPLAWPPRLWVLLIGPCEARRGLHAGAGTHSIMARSAKDPKRPPGKRTKPFHRP